MDELAVIDARGGHWLDKAEEMKPKSKQSLKLEPRLQHKNNLQKETLDECVDGGFYTESLAAGGNRRVADVRRAYYDPY